MHMFYIRGLIASLYFIIKYSTWCKTYKVGKIQEICLVSLIFVYLNLLFCVQISYQADP